ncbi:hypothetical protein TNCT6_40270 [Streptomyces sp. 6-11-2]|nr:hypothetical protein TNCT6_40270 [Streptomyces sp. 6-11-2]
MAIRVKDVTLHAPCAEDQWSEPRIHAATPEVGKQWTGTGQLPDLKRRLEAAGDLPELPDVG